jgi:hypothetical protein
MEMQSPLYYPRYRHFIVFITRNSPEAVSHGFLILERLLQMGSCQINRAPKAPENVM